MKRLSLILTLCPLLLGSPLLMMACAHPPATVTTPQGKAAFTSDQIATRVGELQSATIAANSATPKGLADAPAIVIVKFCVAAEKTLQTTPSGWQQTVATAWAQAKANLPPITNQAVAAAISGVDVVLASFGS